jgi:hypothetical protein
LPDAFTAIPADGSIGTRFDQQHMSVRSTEARNMGFFVALKHLSLRGAKRRCNLVKFGLPKKL